MADTTHITVLIAGRSYPLVVEKAEEQTVLQSVKAINERITAIQAQFQSKDKQDCLAMAFLEMALDRHNKKTETADINLIKQSLAGIEKTISKLLD